MLGTICNIFSEAYNRGYISARDGNVSLGWSNKNYFFVSPSGVRKPELSPDMFLKIKPITSNGYEIVDHEEGFKPTGELPLHFALQRKVSTETRVVLHMHPPYIVAAMYKGINLPDLMQEFSELAYYSKVGDNVPLVPPISQELADTCAKHLGYDYLTGEITNNIVGIDRHGVIAVDTDPYTAFEHIERLEHICKIILVAK